ncbi:MAG: TrkA family potassium uptake protein [Planctomycetes bacterium]|nr:TrkA family potassium uptake protein [Planctomycetota bacterium]MCH9727514.1 TrkA family potassium uptake protein [Planctomycetota bacterium]MCH9777504.1 TrkA family potassium uptake protein [Planctomycetota bacterium]MCH9792372.1 TrkA family potassium uptake protein [Planctomycetota bacterium]MDF1743741.1 TrkA family potassium uptake protein [Gimesia sp.]
MIKVAIIGLGRFGTELAKSLGASKVEVIAIDNSDKLVNVVKDDVAIAVRLNSTDEMALKSQEIDKVDACVISIGENFEAALLTTVIVKKLGVPKIICRAQSKFHAEIFMQIGATDVIQPEVQAGAHLARLLANPHLEDYLQVGDGYTMIELLVPHEFVGKNLTELSLRSKYSVNVVAIRKRNSEEVEKATDKIYTTDCVPHPDYQIQESDILLIIGTDQDLARLPTSNT